MCLVCEEVSGWCVEWVRVWSVRAYALCVNCVIVNVMYM